MTSSLFGIGISGLNAAQVGIATTGHNINNAATAGYNRQQAVQVTSPSMYTGAGFIGRGVMVETVRRVYNEFLVNQVHHTRAQTREMEVYHLQANRLDMLLSDESTGLGSALQDFFGALHGLAGSAASTPSRQMLITNAEMLAQRFRMLEQRLAEEARAASREIAGSVDAINSFARQIAQLNAAITAAEGQGGVHTPNDLLDQRDALVAELNREVKANVIRQNDGTYNVFIGNGQPLVVAQEFYALQAIRAPFDPERLIVAHQTAGKSIPLGEDILKGGRLGGLLAFRTETLDAARNALGQAAVTLAGTLNQQHRMGLDARGEWGGDLFTIAPPAVQTHPANTGNAVISAAYTGDYPAVTASDYRLRFDGGQYTLTRESDGETWTFASLPRTFDGVTIDLSAGAPQSGDDFLIQPAAYGARGIALAIADPSRIAAAAAVTTGSAVANLGTGAIAFESVAGPPAHTDVLAPVAIRFTSAGTFDVIRSDTDTPLATNVVYEPGAAISFNGWTVRLTGEPASGDTFSVARTNGAGDSRNALALAGLQMASTVGGQASYQSAYAQIVSQVGSTARQASVMAKAQAHLESEAVRAQQSASGVNLDEEAAQLLRYQQAYQAAGKVIQVASSMFDSLLGMMR